MRLVTETIEEHHAMFGSGELPAPIHVEVSPNKETEIAYEGQDQEKDQRPRKPVGCESSDSGKGDDSHTSAPSRLEKKK